MSYTKDTQNQKNSIDDLIYKTEIKTQAMRTHVWKPWVKEG